MTGQPSSRACPAISPELVEYHLPRPASTFGRLVHLASLRDPGNGRYTHPELTDCLGCDDFEQTLRSFHERVFANWLSFSLEQQSAELHRYLSSADCNGPTFLSTSRLPKLSIYLPDSATDIERQLFLCDLRVLTALIENERPMEWHMGQSPSINPDHRVFRMMAEARRQHGNVQLSLKSLGVRLRTCDRHLGRLFKKCTGVAFRQYLGSVRMVEAKTRLLRTSQSVQQVALALGYDVSANFTHDFKRCFGLSPVEFRKAQSGSA